MPDPNRSPNSENEKRKEKEETEKEKEKRTETESEMRLDPPYGAPMDVDRADSFIYVSDEDSMFGSEYEMAGEDAGDLIQFGEEPTNTTGTNIPYLPSVPTSSPVAPPTQARVPFGGDNPHLLVPPSSTVTIPPRGHSLAPAPTFRVSLTQTRSSTGTDISHPLLPPSFTDLPPTNGHGPTSNSPQVSSIWQRGLMSHEPTGPPPVYTPRSPPLCVVCNERQAYDDGRRAFPTCGNTCARALEAAKKSMPSVRNSSHTYSSAVSNGSRSFTTNPYQTRQTTIRMCDVCHVRPRCQKNGKIFPTCGLTCAAKLHPPGSVEMCDFCGERPKVVVNGQKFPHCGATCRDKAKISDLASANAATCKTCLICWQAECEDQSQSNYCSDKCQEVANKKAPFLLEVPRGHVAFKKVSDFYTSEWKNTRTPCPPIKKAYKVVMKPDFTPKYEEYRMKVSPSISSRQTSRRKGNEKQLWLRLKRECHFGNAGNMEPCSSKKCILCNLIRSSVSKEIVQHGILRPSSLARAFEMSSQIRKKTPQVVLLANVLLGREIEMTKEEIDFASEELPPHGYDSVHLVRYGMLLGGKTDGEESFVFNADAVKPLYLITHE